MGKCCSVVPLEVSYSSWLNSGYTYGCWVTKEHWPQIDNMWSLLPADFLSCPEHFYQHTFSCSIVWEVQQRVIYTNSVPSISFLYVLRFLRNVSELCVKVTWSVFGLWISLVCTLLAYLAKATLLLQHWFTVLFWLAKQNKTLNPF